MTQDTLSVSSEDLSALEREQFEQAFLARSGTVVWRGRRYQVTAMDQNYPEEASEAILVTFTLKPLGAETNDEGGEHY